MWLGKTFSPVVYQHHFEFLTFQKCTSRRVDALHEPMAPVIFLHLMFTSHLLSIRSLQKGLCASWDLNCVRPSMRHPQTYHVSQGSKLADKTNHQANALSFQRGLHRKHASGTFLLGFNYLNLVNHHSPSAIITHTHLKDVIPFPRGHRCAVPTKSSVNFFSGSLKCAADLFSSTLLHTHDQIEHL